jgi:hypothetical protein
MPSFVLIIIRRLNLTNLLLLRNRGFLKVQLQTLFIGIEML